MIYLTDYDIYFNILLCVTDILVISKLREQIYGRAAKKQRLCIIVLSVLLVGGMMALPGAYGNTFLILPASLILVFFYPKNIKKKILYEVSILSSVAAYMLALNDITNILPKFSGWVMTYIIIFHAGLWGLLFLELRLCSNIETNIPMPLWMIFLLIPVCTFISTFALIPLLNGNQVQRPLSGILHLTVQTTMLFIDITLLKFLQRFTEYFRQEKYDSLLKQQLAYQESHYKSLMDSSLRVKKIRHDMKNHLQTISVLFEERKTEELQEYLRETSDLLRTFEQVVSTGNPSFDAVLNIKLSQMHERGIRCAPVLAVPRGLALSFSDAVTIAGNLLDNAVNACRKIQESAGRGHSVSADGNGSPLYVDLSVTWQQGTLYLHMENPAPDMEKAPYGIGMKNVEEVVRKHSGIMDTEIKDGKYITDIVLCLEN